MKRTLAVALLSAALLTVSFVPSVSAATRTGGVCTLEFDLAFSRSGRILQTAPGTVVCIGTIGSQTVEPARAGADLTGRVRHGSTPCAPVLTQGKLRMLPPRLISFDPRREVHFDGAWKASGSSALAVLNGEGSADGLKMSLDGDARFAARRRGCARSGFSPGTLQMELVIGAGSR